jgi:hypothetical protein
MHEAALIPINEPWRDPADVKSAAPALVALHQPRRCTS